MYFISIRLISCVISLNDRWGGLGNHRYQLGFSGDTTPTWAALNFQPYFTATAANVGFMWSHDIGILRFFSLSFFFFFFFFLFSLFFSLFFSFPFSFLFSFFLLLLFISPYCLFCLHVSFLLSFFLSHLFYSYSPYVL
jgi:hypothetical protein